MEIRHAVWYCKWIKKKKRIEGVGFKCWCSQSIWFTWMVYFLKGPIFYSFHYFNTLPCVYSRIYLLQLQLLLLMLSVSPLQIAGLFATYYESLMNHCSAWPPEWQMGLFAQMKKGRKWHLMSRGFSPCGGQMRMVSYEWCRQEFQIKNF